MQPREARGHGRREDFCATQFPAREMLNRTGNTAHSDLLLPVPVGLVPALGSGPRVYVVFVLVRPAAVGDSVVVAAAAVAAAAAAAAAAAYFGYPS